MATDPLQLSVERPEWSARRTLWPAQGVVLLTTAVGIAACAVLFPWSTARVVVLVSIVFYLVSTVYKLWLVQSSIRSNAEMRVGAEELASLADDRLPAYSILVPLYHESESIGQLVDALSRLEYPAGKLDVQLLLEEDDAETRAAVAGATLPAGWRVPPVPVSRPRTKPKACNIGLGEARGELLVIYDAEDRPEPDQLKKAVVAFRRCPPDIVCLQSKLNFYNPRQNLLTRWFTAEYSAWFDLALPGLCAERSIIPLGGTSNHFRTASLRAMLGWDAFNVTEDCDLGVRIYRCGWGTRMLDTTTWEEACSHLGFWIRQRTRWLKGYLQTYLVHLRQPVRLLRDLGAVNTVRFHLLIGGIILCFLMNPVYWALTVCWFVFRSRFLEPLFPGSVFVLAALCLFVGNFAFIYMGMLGTFRRGAFDLVKYLLISPLYWVLMSVAGWRAVYQLLVAPVYWEKTRHGFHLKPPDGNASGRAAAAPERRTESAVSP